MREIFLQYGFFNGGIKHIFPKDAYFLCKEKNAIILDVRESYLNRFKIFDVENIIFCPQSILNEHFSEIPTDKIVIIADASGIHSKEASLFLLENGFETIFNLAGGIVEWERDKLPLRIDKTNQLSGSCLCQLKFRES